MMRRCLFALLVCALLSVVGCGGGSGSGGDPVSSSDPVSGGGIVSLADVGNDFATAHDLGSISSSISASTTISQYQDYFKMELLAGKTYTISLTGLTDDLDLLLFDSDNLWSEAGRSDQSGSTDESVSLQVFTSATFYVLVRPYLTASSAYTLTVDPQ